MHAMIATVKPENVSFAVSSTPEINDSLRSLSAEEIEHVSGGSRLRDNISTGAFIVGTGGSIGGIGVGLGFAGRTASFARAVFTGARFGAAGGLAGVALGAAGGAAFFAAQEYLF